MHITGFCGFCGIFSHRILEKNPLWFKHSSNPYVGVKVISQKRVHGKEEITKYLSHLLI
jgi:hypothetical protein